MTTDAELLRRFVETRSNPAFAELVQRHVDVVYRSALRRIGGQTGLAADITQEVFTLLARKAPLLTNHQALAAWLYATTRNLAYATLRREMRRQRHEQESIAMDTPERQANEWNQVRCELDAAMDTLAATDREVLLLRFFHNKAFSEIGALVGVEEEAARKRVDRALGRLEVGLRRRGITSTAVALTAFLTGEAALAAPPGLASAVAQNIAAVGPSASATTLLFAKIMSYKITLGIFSAVGFAAVAIVTLSHHSVSSKSPANPTVAEGTSKPAISVRVKQSPTSKEAARPRAVADTLQANIKTLSLGQKPATSTDSQGLVIFDADKTFVDPKNKFGAQLPEGWQVLKMVRWGTEETTIVMRDPNHPAALPSVYYQMFSEPMQPVDTATADAWLRDQTVKKAKARLESGFAEYANGEVTSRTINDRPAVTWTAEYNKNGEPWCEYLTRIYSNNCTVLFFMNAAKKDFPAMIPGFENVIQTAVVP